MESRAPIHPKKEEVWLLLGSGQEVVEVTGKLTIGATCVISLPNKKKELCHTVTRGQLPTAPGSIFLMSGFAGWMKQAAIPGVVKDNPEAPH